MSLREKVCQMFIVTPEQLAGVSGPVTQSGSTTQNAIRETPVGGVIYFAANIRTPEQTTQMIENLQAAAPLGLFIAVDEEGGPVARIGKNAAMGTTSFPAMQEIGNTGDTDRAYNAGLTASSFRSRRGSMRARSLS